MSMAAGKAAAAATLGVPASKRCGTSAQVALSRCTHSIISPPPSMGSSCPAARAGRPGNPGPSGRRPCGPRTPGRRNRGRRRPAGHGPPPGPRRPAPARPLARRAAATSATGLMVPSTLLTCTRLTTRVRAVSKVVELIEVELALIGDREEPQHQAAPTGQHLPGHQVGVMLHLGEQDLVPRLEVMLETPGQQVQPRGGAVGDDHRLARRRVHELRHAPPARLVGRGGLGGQGVESAVHVGVAVAVVLVEGRQDRVRLLAGGGRVQVVRRPRLRARETARGPGRWPGAGIRARLGLGSGVMLNPPGRPRSSRPGSGPGTSMPTGAGLRSTAPVAMSNRAPWRGQVTAPRSRFWSPSGASSWLQTSSSTWTVSAVGRQTSRWSRDPAHRPRASPTGNRRPGVASASRPCQPAPCRRTRRASTRSSSSARSPSGTWHRVGSTKPRTTRRRLSSAGSPRDCR